MRDLKPKSRKEWDELWKKALGENRCIYGCAIFTKPCCHLEHYLKWSPDRTIEEPPRFYTSDVDDFSFQALTYSKEPFPVWSLFKKLRKTGLKRDQIGILVRKYGAGLSNRQILEEMGWTSHDALQRRYTAAIKRLKKIGFGEK